MDYLAILILGIVQGVTEFLPISSSGHLVVVEALYESVTTRSLQDPLELNIVLHGGTLLSIVVVYWNRIWRLLGEDRRMIGLVFVGTIPAVVVGLTMKLYFKHALESPLLTGCMLPITGLILLVAARRPPGDVAYLAISYRQALAIGLVQSFAILPGISRSGSTISAALLLGVRPEAAATFSFLLAIPALAGACVLEAVSMANSGSSSVPPGQLAVGALLSFVVGVLALVWLLNWLGRGRLHYFAYWCIPVGLAIIAWQLLGGA